MDILEKDIEKAFCREAKKRGCLCWKFVSPGRAGVPDRILIGEGGSVIFIEFKQQGKKTRPLQKRIHDELRARGHTVLVIDSLDAVEVFWSQQDIGGESA